MQPKKDAKNKERKETSAEKVQNYLLSKDFGASTDKCKGKTLMFLPVFSLPKTFRIHFQSRSLARGSGRKYKNHLDFVSLLNFQT